MSLPDVPPGPDMVAAIAVESDSVLFIRMSSHKGAYYVLPSGYMKPGENLEAACIRCGCAEITKAARELAQQLEIDLAEDEICLTLGAKVAEHPWDRGRKYHYFIVTGNQTSVVCGPDSIQVVDPDRHLGVWMPFEWVPLSELRSKNIHPPEAVAVCEVARQMAARRDNE